MAARRGGAINPVLGSQLQLLGTDNQCPFKKVNKKTKN